MKSILVISNFYPNEKFPFYGTFVKNFYDQLESDCRVSLIKGVFIKGIKSNLLIKLVSYIIFYSKVIYYILFHKYDIIYVHRITHPIPPLLIASKFKKLNVIYNIHGGDLLVRSKLSRILLKLAVPLLRKAKYIVVPSIFFKSILIKKVSGISNDAIIISPSGGVKQCFYNNRVSSYSDVTTFGFVSRIEEGKGWRSLIEAVQILNNDKIPIRLIMVGTGSQENELRSILKRKEFQNVEYIGPKSYDSLPEFYSSINCFIFPTLLQESLGLVGLEAMAASVPVIGSRCGGLTDYLIDGFNGFFFKGGDVDDLVNKIKSFIALSNKDKQIMSKQAYETSLGYSDKVVSKSLFDKILN